MVVFSPKKLIMQCLNFANDTCIFSLKWQTCCRFVNRPHLIFLLPVNTKALLPSFEILLYITIRPEQKSIKIKIAIDSLFIDRLWCKMTFWNAKTTNLMVSKLKHKRFVKSLRKESAFKKTADSLDLDSRTYKS